MSFAISLTEAQAIETRDDLITEVKAELNRSDISDIEVRSAIQRLEARLNRILRVPAMETVATATLVSGVAALPTDFLVLRALYDAAKHRIAAVDPLAMIETQTGGTKVHAIVGGSIRVAPPADEVVTAIYYAKIPPLNISAPSNWLLKDHADIYFYGTLVALEARIGNDERIGLWKAALDESVGELIDFGNRQRFGGPLTMRMAIPQVRGARI